jgi:O-antigen biosynthesis protein
MTYAPHVTVVVAAYDAEATIGDCVRSLRDLHYPEDKLELVVVDNGSRDRTREVVREHRDRVQLAEEPTRGAGAARNAGVARATGEVVAFTDADCVVDPGWLRSLVAPLRDPRVGIAGGPIRALAPANDVARFGEAVHDHRAAIEVYRPPYAITMSWASPRGVIAELGGFDNRFRRGQDTDLSYRIVQAGYRLAFVPDAIVYHRNEETLAGLFSEGLVHGFHGVRVNKHHDRFLRELGHGRVNRHGYAAIGSGLLGWVRGPDPGRARCDATFNSGKKVGKLLGTVRFGHLDL